MITGTIGPAVSFILERVLFLPLLFQPFYLGFQQGDPLRCLLFRNQIEEHLGLSAMLHAVALVDHRIKLIQFGFWDPELVMLVLFSFSFVIESTLVSRRHQKEVCAVP